MFFRFVPKNIKGFMRPYLWWRRPRYPQNRDGRVCVHLGCGKVNNDKFINIDAICLPHIHHVRSITKLPMFADDTVDLIYASHCLEHIPHRNVLKVLKEWCRPLKKGGMLRLSVPDFDLLCSIYQRNANDIGTIIQPLMGGQDYKHNSHYTVFNRQSLTSALLGAGFDEVRTWEHGVDELTSLDDWSGRPIWINGVAYPVSLNLEAVK